MHKKHILPSVKYLLSIFLFFLESKANLNSKIPNSRFAYLFPNIAFSAASPISIRLSSQI